MIPLTTPEVQRLLVRLLWRRLPPARDHILYWSRWRRHHQYRTQLCHYRKRTGQDVRL